MEQIQQKNAINDAAINLGHCPLKMADEEICNYNLGFSSRAELFRHFEEHQFPDTGAEYCPFDRCEEIIDHDDPEGIMKHFVHRSEHVTLASAKKQKVKRQGRAKEVDELIDLVHGTKEVLDTEKQKRLSLGTSPSPKKAGQPAKKAPAKKTPAKKTPAKKTPKSSGKKVTQTRKTPTPSKTPAKASKPAQTTSPSKKRKRDEDDDTPAQAPAKKAAKASKSGETPAPSTKKAKAAGPKAATTSPTPAPAKKSPAKKTPKAPKAAETPKASPGKKRKREEKEEVEESGLRRSKRTPAKRK